MASNSEILERCAAAARRVLTGNADNAFKLLSEETYAEIARAVVRELREPTEEMTHEGARVYLDTDLATRSVNAPDRVVYISAVAAAHKAMIDEILKEKET